MISSHQTDSALKKSRNVLILCCEGKSLMDLDSE